MIFPPIIGALAGYLTCRWSSDNVIKGIINGAVVGLFDGFRELRRMWDGNNYGEVTSSYKGLTIFGSVVGQLVIGGNVIDAFINGIFDMGILNAVTYNPPS